MARNGSGTFNRLYDWTNDRDNSIKILAERMDAEMDGMATALSQSIASDGQTTTTARVPFGVGITVPVGSVSAPAISFASDSNTGLYSSGANKFNISCNSSNVVQCEENKVSLMGNTATGANGVSVVSINSSADVNAWAGFTCQNSNGAQSGLYVSSVAGGQLTGVYGIAGDYPLALQTGASFTTRLSITGTSGVVSIPGVTSSTSSTTGALVIGGGVGVGQHVTSSGYLWACSGTSLPAGGADGVALYLSNGNFGVYGGSGAPTVVADKGTLYLRSDGSGVNDRMYINTNGSNTWTAVVTVA